MLQNFFLEASPKKAKSIVNDNGFEAFSNLETDKKSQLKRRMIDLAWQIKFSEPSRSKWRRLETNNWTAVCDLNERAKKELRQLLDQEKSRVKSIKTPA